jgi:hypothetical protein
MRRSSSHSPRHLGRAPLVVAALAGAVLGSSPVAAPIAHAQPAAGPASARLQLDGREAHAGLPFVIAMVIEGFEEGPAPTATLTIAGATVTALGAEPNVAQSVRIINGKRTDSRTVTWVLRFRVEVETAQTLQIPAITATQGGRSVTTRKAELQVKALPTSPDMAVRLVMPERPVWVGEPIEVHLDWILRRNPDDPAFSVPLLTMPDDIAFTAPKVTDPRQTIAIPAGARDVDMPFVRDEVQEGGAAATRFRFTFTVTPKRAGLLALPPATVVAGLAVGRPDFFGNSATKLFRATDTARSLEVRALPQAGRPAAFAGAVGTGFALAVRASRSVVSLGEPVELELTVRCDSGLETLALPPLVGDGGLPKASFTVPSDAPIGELAPDGKSKVFRVAAQVIGPATEIPALALAFFDPVAMAYRTVHSEPIALSVKGGGVVVGAADVVAAPVRGGSGSAAAAALPLSGNELALALSTPSTTLEAPRQGGWLWITIGLLYAVPLLIFGGRVVQRRRARTRGATGAWSQASAALRAQLVVARTAPARDSAGPLVTATRALERLADGGPGAGRLADLCDRVERLGYAPTTGAVPLPGELLDELAAATRGLRARPSPAAGGGAGAAALLALLVGAAGPRAAHAAPLDDGRAAYQQALAATGDPAARQRHFATAATQLGEAARAAGDRPELLTDWGNAALGAGDVGTAALAYRRALAIDADAARARQNLAWVRAQLPPELRPRDQGATSTLLFFHAWPRSSRALAGAVAFALAVLLLVPWGRRVRGVRGLAILPALVWAAMMMSLVLQADDSADAVVTQAAVLRTADGGAAPAALASPVPAGAEVVVVEWRGDWSRVRLASGTAGWLPREAVSSVAPRR